MTPLLYIIAIHFLLACIYLIIYNKYKQIIDIDEEISYINTDALSHLIAMIPILNAIMSYIAIKDIVNFYRNKRKIKKILKKHLHDNPELQELVDSS